MGRQNLQKTDFKALNLNLADCEVYEGTVVKNSKTCSKIHVPTSWKEKKVLVVLKNG